VPDTTDYDTLPVEQIERTEPHPAPIFDTGPHPHPLEPLVADPEPVPPDSWAPVPVFEPGAPDAEPATAADARSEPLPVPARPVSVPGQYHYLKRWIFVLTLGGVWIAAAGIGLGLYHWWYHSVDKTWPVFVVLMYVIVCTVVAQLIAMVEDKPLASATAVAVMSAPFASTAAAAALYGMYVFQWVTP
jgi:hypothetical protein